jgi:hypothetical protein
MLRVVGMMVVLVLAGCVGPGPMPAPPPPVKVEEMPLPPATETLLVWQPGSWEWTGAGYEWRPGSFVPREGHGLEWQPGYWTLTPHGWEWVSAHWL